MPTSKWSATGSITTVLSTELNALGSGALSALSAEIDNQNSANRNTYADFELAVDFVSSPTSGLAFVAIFCSQAVDGTNFTDNSVELLTQKLFEMAIAATTAAQRIAVRHVLLPSTKFKLSLQNQSGQPFPASGSTLKMVPYNLELV